jgi:hypothetical protein
MRGDGRIYRETTSRFWWMAYHAHGKEARESTKETDERKARRVLKSRLADVLRGEHIAHEQKVTLADLVEMVKRD